MQKKAVMYGAGNIGRGFIAQLFYLSGYETVFIDVAEPVVNAINEAGEYPIYITNAEKNDYDIFTVRNIRAVNGRDTDAVAREIAEASVMATAVGANILKFIAGPVAQGIEIRAAQKAPVLNIIVCENLIDSGNYFRELLTAQLSDEGKRYCHDKVGIAEASIGRMVPIAPEQIRAVNPLAVCVEPYAHLPVDKSGIIGEPPDIVNLEPFEPFEFHIRRKLFMHNMSHAVIAYLGYQKGYTYIWEAAGDYEIRYTALGALIEVARAMSKEFPVSIDDLIESSYDLLRRFDNKLLGDTIERVGRDPIRKLSPNDRITGAINLCLVHGIIPEHLIRGLAAALCFNAPADAGAQEVSAFARENGAAAALEKYCRITDPRIVERVCSCCKQA